MNVLALGRVIASFTMAILLIFILFSFCMPVKNLKADNYRRHHTELKQRQVAIQRKIVNYSVSINTSLYNETKTPNYHTTMKWPVI